MFVRTKQDEAIVCGQALARRQCLHANSRVTTHTYACTRAPGRGGSTHSPAAAATQTAAAAAAAVTAAAAVDEMCTALLQHPCPMTLGCCRCCLVVLHGCGYEKRTEQHLHAEGEQRAHSLAVVHLPSCSHQILSIWGWAAHENAGRHEQQQQQLMVMMCAVAVVHASTCTCPAAAGALKTPQPSMPGMPPAARAPLQHAALLPLRPLQQLIQV
eukprot:1146291-Pelagomonas_calceolata.AAC.1